MNRKFRLSTALDIDDLLMECVPYAIRLANEKYHFDPPLTIYEVDRWGKLGTRADVIFEFFNDPEFFRSQLGTQGAAAARTGMQPGGEMTAAQADPAPQRTDDAPAAEAQRESAAGAAPEPAPAVPQQGPIPPVPTPPQPNAAPSQPPRTDGDQPDPSLEQLKNGQLSFRFDTLS